MIYIVELLVGIIFTIFLWLVLFPVVLMLATPVILVVALFGRRDRYPIRVGHGYRYVFGFWLDYGLWCMP